MHQIQFVHWKPHEAAKDVERLTQAGFVVNIDTFEGLVTLKAWRQNPPDVFVIDVSRLPSQGRDLAILLRTHKATRFIPLVFVNGKPDKIDNIRNVLPDAIYTTWNDIIADIQTALKRPFSDPIVPDSVFAGYAGTPLTRKLGIKENFTVGLLDAPDGFTTTLGDVPKGVTLLNQETDKVDLVIWFSHSLSEFKDRIATVLKALDDSTKIWLAWPKKSSGLQSDLTQTHVRNTGLDQGWVDFKICAIDGTWSALLFTKRK